MSPDAITAERVYQRLKRDLLVGRFAPGAGINVQGLAAELDLSISPVRDALNRLVGEGIVAMRPGGGFQIPLIDEHSVRDLYAWHGSLLLWALQLKTGFGGDEPPAALTEVGDETDGGTFADATADLFGWIGDRSGNLEHAAAVRRAGNQLRAVRICETFLPDRKAEFNSILENIRAGNNRTLRRAILAYHRRRIDHAQRLVELRYSPINPRGAWSK